MAISLIVRTYADWARIWHQESHSRCREKLVRHLDWACEKDIYKLTRRTSEESGGGGYDGDGDDDGDTGKAANSLFKMNVRKKSVLNPWLPAKEVAGQMLRTRRNGAKGITNECCTRAGCTWEEYAEYCPSNKRRHV